jgi:hypothetical protein
MVYSTYLGGTSDNYGYGVALDSSGSAYAMGVTSASDFPVTANAYQSTLASGALNAFVAKLSADGQSLLYSTYLGGSGQDYAYTIAMDANQNAYVTGQTSTFSLARTKSLCLGYGHSPRQRRGAGRVHKPA